MATDASAARIAATGTWGVLRGSLSGWLTRRGLIRMVLWVAAINGILYFTVVTKNMPFGGLGYETLINMLAVFPPLAAIIAAESNVLGEYRSGVAAWTTSKPVPRSGYVAGKLLGLWIGMSVAAVIIPGLVAYWWLPKVTPYRFVRPEAPPLDSFVGALLALCLVVGFFIMLTALACRPHPPSGSRGADRVHRLPLPPGAAAQPVGGLGSIHVHRAHRHRPQRVVVADPTRLRRAVHRYERRGLDRSGVGGVPDRVDARVPTSGVVSPGHHISRREACVPRTVGGGPVS